MDYLKAFEQYLLSLKDTPSQSTVKNYRADLGQFIRWFEETFTKTFTPTEVTGEIVTMYKKTATERGIAQRSVERHLSSLRKFYGYCKDTHVTMHNPFEAITEATNLAVAKQDPFRLSDFKNHLYITKASDLTIKNYIIDVRQFLTWAETVTGVKEAWNMAEKNLYPKLTPELIEEYKQRLLHEAGMSPLSVNRKLSSIRRYMGWAQQEGLVSHPYQVAGVVADTAEAVMPKASENQPQISTDNATLTTTNGYSKIPPLRLIQKVSRGALWTFDTLFVSLLTNAVQQGQYQIWKASGKKVFAEPAAKTGALWSIANTLSNQQPQSPIKNVSKAFFAPHKISVAALPLHQQLLHHARHTRPNWYRRYHTYPFVHYFHFAILITFMSAMGFGMYQTYFIDPQTKNLALAAPSAPLKILSFQGRLTDASDTPITSSKLLRFVIYDNSSASGSARKWEEVRRVTPDTDGIFNVYLGQADGGTGNAALCNSGNPPASPATAACGIPQNLFGDNPSLWLGITVESDAELTPRQQLATVAYATNAELLQGLPPTTDSGLTTNTNAVLALNSSGTVSIGGSATTTFQATGGELKIQGTSVYLTTNAGTNGNVVLSPEALGKIDLQRPLINSGLSNNLTTAAGSVEVDDLFSVLATSSGQSAFTINQDGAGPLISASASGIAKFTVDNSGTGYFAGNLGIGTTPTTQLDVVGSAKISGYATVSGSLAIGYASAPLGPGHAIFQGNVGIGTSTPGYKLDIVGNSNIAGTLTGLTGLTSSGTITFSGFTNNGGILYANGSGVLAQTAAGTSAQCLLGGTAPAWGSCATGVTTDAFWQQANGALYPSNATVDFLIGGTASSSAKFAVLNVNSGTPTASVSAGTTGAAYLTAGGNLATTAKQTITIGGGNSGNVVFSSNLGADLKPAIDNIYALGSSSLRFKNVYVSGDPNSNSGLILQRVQDSGIGSGSMLSVQTATGTQIGSIDNLARISMGRVTSTGSGSSFVWDANSPGLTITNSQASGYGATNPLYGLVIKRGIDHNDYGRFINFQDSSSTTIGGVGTNGFFWGSTQPAYAMALDLTGSASVSANLSLRGTGTSHTFNVLDNGTLNFQRSIGGDTGLSSTLYLGNTGNVGIGTTAPVGVLHVSGIAAGNATAIFNTANATNDLFTASSSGTPKFTVSKDGFLAIGGSAVNTSNYITAPNFSVTSDGAITAATDETINGIDISAAAVSDVASLSFTTAGNSWATGALTTSGAVTFSTFTTNGGLLYTNGSGLLAQTAAGTSAQCLTGGTTPTYSACNLGTADFYWNQASGALFANNSTVDFLLGAQATASAKFAVLNVASGTPVASVSSGLNGTSIYITADGTLATQNRQTLTIGNSSTYNTTGNVLINPNGTGNVGIGTTAPAEKLSVNGDIAMRKTGSTGYIYAYDSNNTNYVRLYHDGTNANMYANTGSLGLLTGSYAYVDAQAHFRAQGNTWTNATRMYNLDTYGVLDATNSTNVSGSIPMNIQPWGGNVGIGTTAPTGVLHVSGIAAGNATAIFNTGNATNDLLTASSSGTPKFTISNSGGITAAAFTTNGGLLYANGSGVFAQTAAGTSVQCLIGGTTPSWATCGSSNWNVINGVITPKLTSTVDFLLGSQATASAKFAVLNINSGTPTASVSAGVDGNGIYLTADGTLATAKRNTLTIGNSATYNTTGNVLINPNGTGNVGIGTTGPGNNLDVYTDNATTNAVTNMFNLRHTTTGTAADGIGTGLSFESELAGGGATGVAKIEALLTDATNGYGALDFFVNNSGYQRAMRINKDGNVGIGTTAPGTPLQVKTGTGNTYISDYGCGAYGGIGFDSTVTGCTNYALLGNGNTFLNRPSGGSIFFREANATEMTLNSSGNLGIGVDPTLARLQTSVTYTGATTGEQFGQYSDTLYSIADTGLKQGLRTNTTTSHTTGTIADLINTLQITAKNAAGAVSRAYGIFTRVDNNNATNAIDFAYGLYIADSTETGAINNDYGIYQVDTGALNYFGGNVGIGRTVPTQKLDVAGSATLSATLALGPMLQIDAGTCTLSSAGKMYYDATNNTYYYCNGTTWLQMGSGSGSSNWVLNASTGTLSPINNTLDVLIGGTATTSAKFAFTGVTGSNPVASISAQTAAGPALYLDASGNIQTTRKGSLTLGGDTTGNIHLMPNNGSGNVGIGTTAPNALLDVFASLGSTRTSGSQVQHIYNSESAPRWIIDRDSLGSGLPAIAFKSGGAGTVAADGGAIGQAAADSISLYTSNGTALTERMRIIGDGNVGIGTTDPAHGKLVIKADNAGAANRATHLIMQGSTNTDLRFNLGIHTEAVTPYAEISFVEENVAWRDIVFGSQGGNVGIGTTAPSSFKLQVLGNVGPETDATYDLGSISKRWNNVYANAFNLPITGGTGGFWTLTNGLLYPSDTNNSLSIGGTATSSAKFQVFAIGPNAGTASLSGNITFDGTSASVISQTRNAPLTIGSATTGKILLSPKGTTGLLVNELGNVGIGTTAPGYALEVAGTGYFGGTLNATSDFVAGGTSATFNTSNFTVNSSTIVLGDGSNDNIKIGGSTLNINGDSNSQGQVGIGLTNPIARFQLANSGKPALGKALAILDQYENAPIFTASASGVAKFVIQHDGNVGIGTADPVEKLQVAGESSTFAYIGDAGCGGAYTGLSFGTGGLSCTNYSVLGDGTNTYLNAPSGDIYLRQGNNNYATFAPGAATFTTTSFRVTGAGPHYFSTGNLGIGTTAPTGVLHVSGIAAGNATAIFNTGNAVNDLLTASSSGVTKFTVNNGGSAYASQLVDIDNTNYFIDPAASQIAMAVVGSIGIGTSTPLASSGLTISKDTKGNAALVVDQLGLGPLIAASISGTPAFQVSASSTTNTVTSYTANAATATGLTLSTNVSYTTPGSKLLSVQNAGTEKFYIDKDGNVYAAGTILSGQGQGSLMQNKGNPLPNSGLYALVVTDPGNNSAFMGTTSAYVKNVYGVVTGTGLGVSNDADGDGNCDVNDNCMVAQSGEVSVLVKNTNAAKGDFVYTSDTYGLALTSAKQFDGVVGIVTSTAGLGDSPATIKMVFVMQPQVTAANAIDKNARHNEYHLLSRSYQYDAEGINPDPNIPLQGMFFDNFLDNLKTASDATPSAVMVQSPNSKYTVSAPYRVGLYGGQTMSTATTDNAGKTYLGDNNIQDLYYYDRTRDSAPEVLVDLGVDPNWYNGVTLSIATTAANMTFAASGSAILKPNPNLSTTYNGSLMKVTGTYASNAKTIWVTIKTPGGNTGSGQPTFDWTDYNGNAGTSIVMTPGTAQALGGTGVSVTFSGARYNTGDVFRIASWFVEPSGSTRGAKQQFPERSYLITEFTTSTPILDIIDADTQKLWMRFTGAGASNITSQEIGVFSPAYRTKSVHALNGKVYVGIVRDAGADSSSATGLNSIGFDNDKVIKYHTTLTNSTYIKPSGIASRAVAEFWVQSNAIALNTGNINDVHAAVVPNQPAGEITISGTGYVVGNGTNSITDVVTLPYKFDKTPAITVQTGSAAPTSTTPQDPSQCTSLGGVFGEVGSTSGNSFAITIQRQDSGHTTSSSFYYCYSWTATGKVSPRQYVAAGTAAGVSIVNETDQSVLNSINNPTVVGVWITSKGDVYFNSDDSGDASGDFTSANYQVLNRGSWSLSGGGDKYYRHNTTPAARTTIGSGQVLTSLSVSEGTSTIDGRSNTLYIGTTQGLTVLQEKQNFAGSTDDWDEEINSSVKYFTKDYVTEEMVGDIRAMWPLDSDYGSGVSDASVKANTLTNTGTTTFTTSGVRGSAANVNGSTQYLSCTDASCGGLDKLDPTRVTISAWVKPDVVNINGMIAGKNGSVAGDDSYMIWITNDPTISFLISFDGTTGTSINATTKPVAGQWYHIVGTFDGAQAKIYVNGVLEKTTAASGNLFNSPAIFTIGADAQQNLDFDGTIDEVMVTATPLTANQVRQLYQTGYRALQSHATTLGGGSADTNQQLGFISTGTNTIGDARPDINNQFVYVGTNSTTLGAVSKIDLLSDTNVKTYNSSANVPTGGTLLIDEDTTKLAVGYNLEAVGSAASGVKVMSPDNGSSGTSGTFYSKTYTANEAFSQAYVWSQIATDSQDTSNIVTVSASNDGGSNYTQCNQTNTNSSTTPPEYEYFCQFNTAGTQLKMKYVFARGSTKTNTYMTRYGVAWISENAVSNSNSTNGVFTSGTTTVGDGGYVEVAHNKATNDLLANGWIQVDGKWTQVDAGYKPAIAWEGKDTHRELYHQMTNTYTPGGEQSSASAMVTKGLLFDTFEDSTKTDTSGLSTSLEQQKMDNGVANQIVSNTRFQTGRTGLTGGRSYNITTRDNDNSVYAVSNQTTDTYYYDRTRDSKPEVLVDLGIDPNWANGVTLSVATSSSNMTFAASGSAVMTNSHLSTTYNGSLLKAEGTYSASTSAKTIFITVKTPTQTGTPTFDWTNYWGEAATGVTMTPGTKQTLGNTGVSVTFANAKYNSGDVFNIASWYTEPFSKDFRGNRRDFPERAYIIGEHTEGVTVIDADTQKVWMRFYTGGYAYLNLVTGRPVSSVHMLNGHMYVGKNGSGNGMSVVKFDTDSGYSQSATTGIHISGRPIAARNDNSAWTAVNLGSAIIGDTVNDVHTAVVPNQPAGEVTVSGWGYIQGDSTQEIEETVSLPYRFDETPRVTTTYGNYIAGTVPTSLSTCTTNTTSTGVFATSTRSVTPTSFEVQIDTSDAISTGPSSQYFCYSWTATGKVSPKMMTSVATDSGLSIVNETDNLVASMTEGATTANTVKSTQITSKGDVYFTSCDATKCYYVAGFYGAGSRTGSAFANQTTAVGWDFLYRVNWSGGAGEILNGVGTSDATTIQTNPQAIYVTEGTSTADGKSNTIYVSLNAGSGGSGATVLQEYRMNGSSVPTQIGADAYAGERVKAQVKYYTKDYVTETITESTRGMWPMDSDFGSGVSDASPKSVTLTNNNTTTFTTSGVRGSTSLFNGTTQYLSCTDASCGGLSKTDFTQNSPVTISAWVKLTDTTSGSRTIMAKGDGPYNGTAADWYLAIRSDVSGALEWLGSTAGSGFVQARSTIGITDTNWHHVVFTTGSFCTSTVAAGYSFYIDGKNAGSTIPSATGCTVTTDNAGAFTIGALPNGGAPTNFFKGSIDEPFISAETITENQVRQMYETGSRALQSHSASLGGSGADANQQLTGTTSITYFAQPDFNNQFMYVGTNSSGNGGVSKIDLLSDTNVKSYLNSANVPTGGTTLNGTESSSSSYNNVIGAAVGYDGELFGSAALGSVNIGIDNYSDDTTGSFVSKMYTLPKPIASAVIWASPVIDSADASNTVTVKASVNNGSSYTTCTQVGGADGNPSVPEREYSCSFASSGTQLKVKFDFARGSTKTNTYLTQYGISWLGQTGFRIEQTDTNIVRLYNYTGESRDLRLDVATGTITRNAGTVSLRPDVADTDSQIGGNSLWINKTGAGGNIMKLQASGSDIFTLSPAYLGNNAAASFAASLNPLTDNTYSLGATGSARWKDMYLGPSSLHIQCKSGEGNGCTSQTLDWAIGADTSNGNFQISANGTSSNAQQKLVINQAGNVGIGTTAPAALTHISKAGSGATTELLRLENTQSNANVGAQISFAFAGTEGSRIISKNNNDAAYNLRFETYLSGTLSEKMVLTGSGNLGIGTTAPGAKLDLSVDNTVNADGLKITRVGTGTGVSTTLRSLTINQTSANGTTTNEGIYVNVLHNIADIATGINSNATVVYTTGIGVLGKGTQQDMNGYGTAIGIKGVTTGTAAGGNGTTYAGYFDNTTTVAGNNYGVYINTASGGDYGLYQAGTGVNYFAGNVGVGTSPTYKLHAAGNIVNSAPNQGWLGLTGDLPGYSNDTYPTLKTSYSYMYFSVGGAYSAHMNSAGTLTAVSDREKKENFVVLDEQEILGKISQLPAVQWNFKGEDASIKHIAPIAQDFHELFGLNGSNNKMISHIDPAGVALVGIKALNTKIASLAAAQQTTVTALGDLSIVNSNVATLSADALGPFELKYPGGEIISRVGAYAELAVANLRSGAVSAQQITTTTLSVTTENVDIAGKNIRDYIAQVVDERLTQRAYNPEGSSSGIVAPIASIDVINTNIISPLASDTIIVDGKLVARAPLATDGATIAFEVQNASGSAVASIDSDGNASFSGKLVADSLQATNATIAGTLRAKKIIADDIEGLTAKIGTLAAQQIYNVNNVTNVYATPSATSVASATPDPKTISLLSSSIKSDYANLSTMSGMLASITTINAEFGQFNQGLMALGPSSFVDTAVMGQLSVGTQLTIADNSINVLGTTLEIQSLRQGALSLMGGLIMIDTDGNAIFGGNAEFAKDVKVRGNLATNVISPLADSDLSVRLPLSSDELRLATGSAAQHLARAGRFVIQDASGSGVLSVNALGDLFASGSATIGKLNFNVVSPVQALSNTESIATGSAGVARLKANQVEVTINNTLISKDSLIYVTPVGTPSGQAPYLLRQAPGKSFTVGLPSSSSKDTFFNWLIVN